MCDGNVYATFSIVNEVKLRITKGLIVRHGDNILLFRSVIGTSSCRSGDGKPS